MDLSDGGITRPARLLGVIALLALLVGCLLVLRPFISALLWGAILAYCTWPAFRSLRDRARLTPSFAAAVMVLTLFLLVGLPLVLATPTDRAQIDGLRAWLERLISGGLPGLTGWIGQIPYVGGFLQQRWDALELDFSGLAALIQPYAGAIAQNLLGFLLAVLSGIAELLFAIILAFFFYRDGPRMAAAAERLITRIAGPTGARQLTLVGDVTRGVVWGLLGTAIIQGVMTTFGLWLSGVPQPVLLGVIAGVISILPVGAPLVWIPATLWLFAQGSIGWGIFMGLYGAFGISSVDNIIRPWLISRGADLPMLLTILGALGGVFAFGFLGLFLGPVLLAVGFSLLREWAAEAEPTP